jgi:hypothetical protein
LNVQNVVDGRFLMAEKLSEENLFVLIVWGVIE